MFYKQSVDNVEMVILCLDGGILDLNRLRYNYFNRICKQYNHTVSKEAFTATLGNSKIMYNQSPIQEVMGHNDINELIEKDLYQYAKLKQNIKKDGVDELLQFFKQKKIKVAIISTHKTKRAIQYLQLAGIYRYVDFVIGGDSQHMPLPDSSILHAVCTKMEVAKENTVVVANFPSLVKAAGEIFMNIIYLEDLVPATADISASVYKTVKSNLEMINIFLFSKYDNLEMFSSVLGMSKEMDLVTLERTYQRLLLEYKDDLQLTALVKKTYRFFLMEINEVTMHSKEAETLDTMFTSTTNDIESHSVVNNNPIIDTFANEIENSNTCDNEESNVVDDIIETTETISKSVPIVKDTKEAVNVTASSMPKSFVQDAIVLNELMDRINETSIQDTSSDSISGSNSTTANTVNDTTNHVASVPSENVSSTKKVKESYGALDGILDFAYVSIMSFVASIVGAVCYMVVSDYLQSKSIITSVINTVIDSYVLAVRSVYMFIFDGIHTMLSFIPDYQSLLAENQFLSSLAIEVIMFSIFNIVVYYIIRTIYHFIKKRSGNSD